MREIFTAVLTLAAGLSALAATAADEPAGCRDIPDDVARLACYDAAFARATPAADPVPPAATGKAAPAAIAPPSPQPTPEELFGRDAVAAEALVREAAGIGRVEAIESTISSVTATAYGKQVVTLGNGQAWTQIDSAAVKLGPGDAVTIRRAALGSYLLIPGNGGRSMRVTRSR